MPTRGYIDVVYKDDSPGCTDITHYGFWCPGCQQMHYFDKRWTFNYNFLKPTFTPSLLLRNGKFETLCHLFLTDGKIKYLSDCRHKLAGKTVDMEGIL